MIVDASALLLLALPQGRPALDANRLDAVLARVALREALEAPTLLAYELGNVVHRKRARDIGTSKADRVAAVRRLLGVVELRGVDADFMAKAGETTEASRASFYDATYLTHAALTRSALLTADAGMKSHASTLGLIAFLLPNDLDALEKAYPAAQV